MILYKIVTVRLIKYLGLGEILLPVVDTKPSEIIKLKLNEKLDTTISVLTTILCFFNCLTLPFVVLKEPLLIFCRNDLMYLHHIMKYIEDSLHIIDRLILTLFLLLIYVSVITILDAIKNTKINISPWVQKGKYFPRGYKPPVDPKVDRKASEKAQPDPYGALDFRMRNVKIVTPKYEKRKSD